ncbi:hypothetical protein MBAV_003018, partial [Candidatus Magnetobacterium bavaricum]
MCCNAVSRLDIINTSGDIFIQNAKALTLADLNSDTLSIDNAGGGKIKALGALNITSTIRQANDFSLIAGDTEAQADNLTISNDIINTTSSA